MRFAALADIHGNAFALQAVLRDMDSLGISMAVNLGDFFSGPLDASKTEDLLAARAFPSIRGNHDRYLITQTPAGMGPSDRVAYDQLSQAALDWIGTLPETRMVFGDVFLCHGTPNSDATYWLERVEADGTTRRATLNEVEDHAQGIQARLILCAHTHIPRVLRLRDGRMIVNPGSVGCPAYDDDTPVYHYMQTGTPDASYAVIEQTGTGWSVTFRSVPYDTEAASRQAAQHGRPDWARALATGWFTA